MQDSFQRGRSEGSHVDPLGEVTGEASGIGLKRIKVIEKGTMIAKAGQAFLDTPLREAFPQF